MLLPITLIAMLTLFCSAAGVSFALMLPALNWAEAQRTDFASVVGAVLSALIFGACMVAAFRVMFRYARWEQQWEIRRHQRDTSDGRRKNS